jgi:hypothetical protein
MSSAASAAESNGATESRHRVDVIATAGAGVAAGRVNPLLYELEMGAYWRTAPRVAVGLVGARTWTIVPRADALQDAAYDTSLWRLAPALRWDYHRGSFSRAWIGGQAGVALVVDRVYRFTTAVPSTSLGRATDTRAAPMLAVDAGIALVAGEWVSLGADAKAFHLATGAPEAAGSAVVGPLDGFYAGLALALHVPLGPRDPR